MESMFKYKIICENHHKRPSHISYNKMRYMSYIIEATHVGSPDVVSNSYVRFHCFIIGMPRPFHYDIDRYSKCKSFTNESLAPSMGGKELILLIYGVNAVIPSILGYSYRCVDTCEFSKLLDIIVHLLIADYREYATVLKLAVLVFLKYSSAMLVQFNSDGISGLHGRKLNMILSNIALAEIGYIRISQTGVTAED